MADTDRGRSEGEAPVSVVVGEELAPITRVTGFDNWNRFAAVNDEFIDVHMDHAAAQAVGQPGAFGMGALRLAYIYELLENWVASRGSVASLRCQYREINRLGDELTTVGRVVSVDGGLATVELGVVNQDGKETTPAVAEVRLAGAESTATAPERPAPPERERGVYLDDVILSWLGRAVPPIVSEPIGANDILRWRRAVAYPAEPAPSPDSQGELVAPLGFNPFAWHPKVRWSSPPWFRGQTMGLTGPGTRGLIGGVHHWYETEMRVGDVLTSDFALIDAYEKQSSSGELLLFLVDEDRWTNADGELARVERRTTIYR